MAGDLHCHSTLSDGSVRIERLAPMAESLGLSTLAVSDHDSWQSVQYAYAHPVQNGVRLVPATELSAYDAEHGRRVHLLCYWPDECSALRQHCETMQARRNAACLQSARELEQIYPQFRTEQAMEYAQDSGTLYKSSIMRALGELGLSDGIYGKLYRELFSSTPPGRVFHKTGYDTVEQVLQVVRDSRAVVVFAHPSVYKSMPLVRRLAQEGQIDGIEIDHPRNTAEDQAECLELCRRYNLIPTGGTDFHGSHSAHPRPLGSYRTAEEQIERIAALAKQRKSG